MSEVAAPKCLKVITAALSHLLLLRSITKSVARFRLSSRRCHFSMPVDDFFARRGKIHMCC
jgi:hypothetical protein